MPVHSSILATDVLIVMIASASLSAAGVSPANQMGLLCLVGGCIGAFCSLHFFRVPPSPHASADIAWQFLVNLALSWSFTPLAVRYAAAVAGLDPTEIVIPMATVLGILSQRIAAKVLPAIQQAAERKAERALRKAQGLVLDVSEDDQVPPFGGYPCRRCSRRGAQSPGGTRLLRESARRLHRGMTGGSRFPLSTPNPLVTGTMTLRQTIESGTTGFVTLPLPEWRAALTAAKSEDAATTRTLNELRAGADSAGNVAEVGVRRDQARMVLLLLGVTGDVDG